MNSKFTLFVIAILCNCNITFSQDYHLPKINKEFQVVAHIVLDTAGNSDFSAGVVAGLLAGAETYFAPIGVTFNLCQTRIVPNFQYYDTVRDPIVTDEMKRQFYTENRINLFCVGSHVSAGGVCYSNVGSGTGLILLTGPSVGTLTHELGHHFGLIHTFGPSKAPNGVLTDELADSSNCATAGDQVCDTPADPYIDGGAQPQVSNCQYVDNVIKDANGDLYNPIMYNIMNYYGCGSTPPGCPPSPYRGFTRGQYIRMVEQYLSAQGRKSW